MTGDVTCVSFLNVESQEQSKEWMHTHSSNKPKKFKQMSASKLKVTVFWDRRGVLMVKFMQQGTTLSEVYCETPKGLCRAKQNKRHKMLTYSVVLLHDNAHPHTAARTQALLEHFSWELFDHPCYSPDLASSGYHLFTYQKNWLGSKHFNNNEELVGGVKAWLSPQAADVFDTGMQKLFLDTSVSILVMTTSISSLSMSVFFVYNNFFLHCLFY
jgi:histone-lysine N-methyltransferase SETMAR